MNIVLCGFMGSGKTTVGKLIAKLSGRKFVDTDELIVRNEKMSISDIFEKHGEQYFRDAEKAAVTQAASMQNAVISTGGGVVLRADNVEILKTSGRIFYLSVTAKTVLSRLKNDKSRPLLQRDDKEKAVKELMQERRERYLSAADCLVSCDNRTPKQIALEILEKTNK